MQPDITLQQLRSVIAVAEFGSINAASQNLYVSQPSLSQTIKDVEESLGFTLFNRTNRGITLTAEGVEFVGYARQVIEQVELLQQRYSSSGGATATKLSISSQHYAFAVKAFVEMAESFDADEYEFRLTETETGKIIDNVKTYRSELGIVYLSKFNEKVLTKAFADAGLEFIPLFKADPHVFVGADHPLANRKSISPDELEDYPRYSFSQGINNSFFFSEEPLSELPHKKQVIISDRGTLSNLLTHHKGYTFSTGVLSDEMNEGIVAIPLECDEVMTVGYLKHAGIELSELAQLYISKLQAYIEANPTVQHTIS